MHTLLGNESSIIITRDPIFEEPTLAYTRVGPFDEPLCLWSGRNSPVTAQVSEFLDAFVVELLRRKPIGTRTLKERTVEVSFRVIASAMRHSGARRVLSRQNCQVFFLCRR